jgi:hypothetical protein
MPPNRATRADVHERFGILVGEAGSPLGETLVRQTGAFRVGILKRFLKFGAPTAFQLITNRFSHELAPVLLPPIDIAKELIG